MKMEIISGSGVIGTVPTFLNYLLERSLWTRRRRRRRWRWTRREVQQDELGMEACWLRVVVDIGE